MYNVLPGVGLGTGVLGTKIVAEQGGAAGAVASNILPLTGIAFSAYVALAVVLFVVGVVLRVAGRTQEV